jgi:hypothetical protein
MAGGTKKTVGVYPLLTNESCWFLAADFDKSTWQEDALEFVTTCGRLGVPAYLERSRSGNGGHVWIFFDPATPAVLARKMGCAILTQTMERRHHLGLDSYEPFLSQSGHDATRGIWKSDRPSPSVVSAADGQQPLRG